MAAFSLHGVGEVEETQPATICCEWNHWFLLIRFFESEAPVHLYFKAHPETEMKATCCLGNFGLGLWISHPDQIPDVVKPKLLLLNDVLDGALPMILHDDRWPAFSEVLAQVLPQWRA
jgi:hypothetical protein